MDNSLDRDLELLRSLVGKSDQQEVLVGLIDRLEIAIKAVQFWNEAPGNTRDVAWWNEWQRRLLILEDYYEFYSKKTGRPRKLLSKVIEDANKN